MERGGHGRRGSTGNHADLRMQAYGACKAVACASPAAGAPHRRFCLPGLRGRDPDPVERGLRYPHPAHPRHHPWHHRLLHRQRARLPAGDPGRAESPRRCDARSRALSRERAHARDDPRRRAPGSPHLDGGGWPARACCQPSAWARRAERPGPPVALRGVARRGLSRGADPRHAGLGRSRRSLQSDAQDGAAEAR